MQMLSIIIIIIIIIIITQLGPANSIMAQPQSAKLRKIVLRHNVHERTG